MAGQSFRDLPESIDITLAALDFHLETANIISPESFEQIFVIWVSILVFSMGSTFVPFRKAYRIRKNRRRENGEE